jgi:large subunit ribosomal protein L19e
MRQIRAQRRLLKELRDEGRLSPADYRKAYLRAKGGVYRSKAHLLQQLEAEGLLKGAEE